MTAEGINRTTNADLEAARALFARHGIGDLLGVEIVNKHDGTLTTVGEALETCGPFASGLLSTEEALTDVGMPEMVAATVTDFINGQRHPAAGEV